MSEQAGLRIFVPETAVTGNRENLEPASGDETFYLVGPPGRYELPGFAVTLDQLEDCGIPRKVAREVAMIVSLRTSEHVMLLQHGGGLWELLIQSGKGLPDTYTFKVLPSTGKSGTA